MNVWPSAFVPGDTIVACDQLRSWETLYERGKNGRTINAGQSALLLAIVETGGNKRRLVVLFDGQLAYFSCDIRHANRNWKTLQQHERRNKCYA